MSLENNSKTEIDSLWAEMLRKAVLDGCENGSGEAFEFREKVKIYQEPPVDFGEIPFNLLEQFEIGDISVWEIFMKEGRSANSIVEDFIFWDKKNGWLKISDFAPKGTFFVSGNDFLLSSVGKNAKESPRFVIMYNENKLRNESGFIFLFHEIGHSCLYDDASERLYDKIKIIGGDAHNKSISSDQIMRKYSDEETGLLLQNERNAWAWAIKMLRLLKGKGFDLIPGFGKEELTAYIFNEKRLGSYCHKLNFADNNLLRDIRKAHLAKMIHEK